MRRAAAQSCGFSLKIIAYFGIRRFRGIGRERPWGGQVIREVHDLNSLRRYVYEKVAPNLLSLLADLTVNQAMGIRTPWTMGSR